MKTSIVASVLVAACAAFTSYAEGVISVNLTASGGNTVSGSGTYGLEPAVGDTWYNVTEMGSGDDLQHFTIKVESETRDGVAKKLDDAVSVTFTTDALEKQFERYYQSGIHGDDDAFMYNYLNDNGNITVDVANVPYKAYRVIVYVGADFAHGHSNAGWADPPDFSPIGVNGTFYRYSDETKTAVVCDLNEAGCWGEYGSGTAEEGRNVIITPAQYGSPLQIYIPKIWNVRRSALSAFQIVEVESELKPVTGAISVNFVDKAHDDDYWHNTFLPEEGRVPDLAGGWGFQPGESWNNISTIVEWTAGSQPLKVWQDGVVIPAEDSSIVMSWENIGGTYYDVAFQIRSPANRYLWGFASDGGTPRISVSGIPFEEYDLIVYMSGDWGKSDDHDFNPVEVNGQKYTWSDELQEVVKTPDDRAYWGEIAQGVAEYGVNAIRIRGLTGREVLFNAGNCGDGHARGSIAAFQIVKPMSADYVAEGDITTREINKLAKEGKAFTVEIPAGKKLILSKKPLVCSTLKVICKGDLVLDTDHEPNETDIAGWPTIDYSGVRGTVYRSWLSPASVISLNFVGHERPVGTVGMVRGLVDQDVPAVSWNNLSGNSGINESVVSWTGVQCVTSVVDGLSVRWFGGGVWHEGGDDFDSFLRGFITDSDVNPPSVTVFGIPFAKYDVIVYMAADWKWHDYHPECENADFQHVVVNDMSYTWDSDRQMVVEGTAAWGEIKHAHAELGVNALRICDLESADLRIVTHSQNADGRGNIAAIQIVEHVKPRRYTQPLIITVR